MKQILAITRKELNSYFGSPMALIFIGVFLAATLFTFFWLDTFFARGIADVRPLFRWMPLLLIFLVAALTMRQWSQEAQSGTLEVLLTLPIPYWKLVLGKFLAVLTLVALSLLLTVSLPITVSMLGNLDWGPVIGGYLAALLMASAYAALGLFISSRTRNEIVALILTVVAGGILYLIGTRGVTEFTGETVGNILRALATGSRFESIERGVVDLRDLVYYLSLTVLFLALNVFSLDTKRWSHGNRSLAYRRNASLGISLLAINLVLLNVWLYPLSAIRADITQQREYSLSPVTRDLLHNLQEPLLIRAYFSERTHPLLAPLVPRITDMLREYEVAGGGQVNVEIVDPAQNPELEAEANQTYGIRPTPFQIAGRYEASVVNAYFDILIRYGDQNEVLNFSDLIEVESFRDGQMEVKLRNLEYDLTRSIKRSVFGFQNLDSILASLSAPAKLTLVVTPDTLPAELAEAPATIQQVAEEVAASSNGNFAFEQINPDDPNAPLNRDALLEGYNIQPFAASLFADSTYFLHMLLQVGDNTQVIYPSGDLSEASVRQGIEQALKRTSSGFLQVVGIWRPTIGPDPTMAQMGQTQQPPFSTWNTLFQQLSQDYEVRPLDLVDGQVPPDIDVLLVVAPQQMADTQRYAIDQFLMRGGAVIVAGSNFRVTADPFTGMLTLAPIADGLKEMLGHYGVNVEDSLVLDPQNEPFPIAITRDVGGFAMQELQSLNYPYFVDVRTDGMASGNPMISNLPAVTLNWVSPVRVDEAANSGHEVTTLLHSTAGAWTSSDTNIQPNPDQYPEFGFPPAEKRAEQPLAVSIIGSFDSFFAGKESPLTAQPAEGDAAAQTAAPTPAAPTTGTIEKSPETARLVVIGSGDFLNDTVFTISSQLAADRYLNSLQFVQNAVDWAVEDLDLLTIRSRGSSSRVLEPLAPDEQSMWEFANYGFALVALVIIGLWWASRRRAEQPMNLSPNPFEKPDQEVSLERL
ncbi:MAG: Gldg family protein [Caldilineaceae bacterium]|nr:Gldg family protein [Caldilineaceae bacterium]